MDEKMSSYGCRKLVVGGGGVFVGAACQRSDCGVRRMVVQSFEPHEFFSSVLFFFFVCEEEKKRL